MLTRLIFILLALAASPLELRIERGSKAHMSVRFAEHSYRELRGQLHSGLELRFRYTIKLCERYSTWFDSCADEFVQIYRIKHDPVTESFRVTTDRLGDDDEPVTVSYTDLEKALKVVSAIDDLSLELLPDWKKLSSQAKHAYVSVRLVISLRDAERSILEWVPRILTLGLIDSAGFDTGWHDMILW